MFSKLAENFSLINALSFSRSLPERSTEAGTSSEFQIGAKTLFQLNIPVSNKEVITHLFVVEKNKIFLASERKVFSVR